MSQARLDAQKGFLSVQTYDFYQNAPISLNGDWAFYWEAFRDPNQLPWPDPPYYMPVPASWNTRKMPNGRYFPHYGYATYRLRVLLPPKRPPLGLYIPKIWSASKVWVNGQLISSLGDLSNRFEGYRNQIVEKVEPIEAKSDTLDLVVQVANFDIFVAGLAQEFRLGAFQKVRENTALAYSWTLMWLGALFLMGLYHLVLFAFRRKQVSTLFFGSICLLIGVRQVVFGDHYLYEYLKLHAGWLDFKWQSSIYYITTFALGPLGLAYIRSLYPPKINFWVLRIATGLTTLYALFILLTPPRVYMPTITVFNAVFVPMILYMLVAIVRAALKKRNETGLLMTGIMVLVVAGLNDIFHQIGWELFGYLELLPLAFAIFLSIQFVVLAKRFSRAFREVEDLSANLERKVEERTAELNRKKKRWNKRAKSWSEPTPKSTTVWSMPAASKNLF
ncbi:MAG: hypothetical protein HC913_11230 [Microscillaceae bacterium]|nr:hypothetical protein [Microscillaceae bacterium]